MHKKLMVIILAAIVMVAGLWFVFKGGSGGNGSLTDKKAPHFESSTPASGMVLAAVPPNVTIDFNFDLAEGSEIFITANGDEDYSTAETTIDDNKLAMRRSMSQDAPDGTYTVMYKACWPDGSCHDGQFSFTVDRTLVSSYIDQRNQAEVIVKLSQIEFAPMEIRVSKGTKVTWVNNEQAVHYVNTDSHPAHTHTPGLNSRALNKGDSYTFTFAEAGAYPYHCSAHASSMRGTVVVE